jgi:hypothetical protein
MLALGDNLSAQQIADVASYAPIHFGNGLGSGVRAADVKILQCSLRAAQF